MFSWICHKLNSLSSLRSDCDCNDENCVVSDVNQSKMYFRLCIMVKLVHFLLNEYTMMRRMMTSQIVSCCRT